MKKVTSVEKTQIVKTQRDVTDANARLVSMEMDTTAQVSQCLFGSLVVGSLVVVPFQHANGTGKLSYKRGIISLGKKAKRRAYNRNIMLVYH